MLEVVADKPLGLGLSAEDEAKAVRVEETPRKRVEEVRSKADRSREGRNERKEGVTDKQNERKVSRARGSAMAINDR